MEPKDSLLYSQEPATGYSGQWVFTLVFLMEDLKDG
jgi:hypothetical protein